MASVFSPGIDSGYKTPASLASTITPVKTPVHPTQIRHITWAPLPARNQQPPAAPKPKAAQHITFGRLPVPNRQDNTSAISSSFQSLSSSNESLQFCSRPHSPPSPPPPAAAAKPKQKPKGKAFWIKPEAKKPRRQLRQPVQARKRGLAAPHRRRQRALSPAPEASANSEVQEEESEPEDEISPNSTSKPIDIPGRETTGKSPSLEDLLGNVTFRPRRSKRGKDEEVEFCRRISEEWNCGWKHW